MRNRIKILAAVVLGLILAVQLLLVLFPFKNLSSFESKPVSKVFFDDTGKLLQVTSLQDGTRCEYIPVAMRWWR